MGVFAIPNTYDNVESFMDGTASVALNDTWRIIDKQGHFLYDNKYKNIFDSDNDRLIVINCD
jgi:hypothetical protein